MTFRIAEKQLKSNLKYLRKAAKDVRLSLIYKIVRQILRENLQFLEREGLAVFKQRRQLKKLPGTLMVSLCEDAVLHMNPSIISSLKEQLEIQNRWLTTYELSAIPDLLKMFLINLATVGVKSENSDILESALSGLHQLKDLDLERIFEAYSYTEAVFSKDPAGIYTQMDCQTKAYYRHRCAQEAIRQKKSENQYADELLEAALKVRPGENHIGYFLLYHSGEERRRLTLGVGMLVCRILLPLLFAVLLGAAVDTLWLALLFYPVLHRILRPFVERLFLIKTPPHFMPRMELNQVVPKRYHTLVTVSALLPKAPQAQEMADHLERLYLANNNGAIDFCLLADFPEAKEKYQPDDQKRVDAMIDSIDRLNQKYDDRFLLVIRPRVYSKTQNAYSGWERKRGALLQLMEAIHKQTNQFHTVIDPSNRLPSVQYILALDQDSELLFNSAYEMITAAAHPVNQPHIDPEKGIVTRGYGILTPLIANRIDSVSTTAFLKIHAGRGGVSAYNAFCSNHYQDLFSQTVFSGKGLIHVNACYTCLQDKIEPERILSHDIVEGAFLRCGLVSDVEIADSNPSNATAWNKRQHRWIRGDFQNVLWLLPYIGKDHQQYKNPLGCLSRIMMGDNLLRAFYPVFSLLLLLYGAFDSSLALLCAALAVAGVLAEGIYSFVISLIRNGFSSINQQYYSHALPTAVNHLLRCIFSLCSLVTDSVIAVTAAAKGLYRQFISHKNCMEWSTAWEVDFNNKNGITAYVYHNAASVILGGILLFFAAFPISFLGLLFLLCPMIQWWSAQPISNSKMPSLTPQETTFLQAEGKKIWQYYEDFCTKEDNWLPPDNMQEQPIYAVAHRTSPTNIGLMMLSCICARDLGYISEEEMVVRLTRTYKSVQALERWNGHLLNWYDTQTLAPLFPRYCSTVDSGNFACLLTAVKNGLQTIKANGAQELADQIQADLDIMDFKPLYNAHRRLFHIGYDLETQSLSTSYYDMLMSESRMTGYYAIAKRQIPKKHWSALGRTLTRNGQYVGPMSWTGTAFEYLMPTLILPVKENTLSYEAVRFCIACQKKAARRDLPWGCSESGYYEFDDDLIYQYKPNGINTLALKCFDKQEYIVSPYSSFLAMPFTPKSAIKNLQKIQRLGGSGSYGFYEAMDFTKQRCTNCDREIVRSYMAHHVGMSLCAIENTLNNNRLQHLFMQGEMKGAEALLMEIIPGGASVYNHYTEKDIPEKPHLPLRTVASSQKPQPDAPRFTLLSNKQLKLLLGDNGCSVSVWRDLVLYGSSKDRLENTPGIMFYFGEGDDLRSLTLSPRYGSQNEYRVESGKNSTLFSCKAKDWTGTVHVSIGAESPAECRKITLKNRTGRILKGRLVIYFEPYLHTKEQMRSHPAFYKLFLQSRFDPQTNRVLFKKRVRSEDTPACLLAGFADKSPFALQANTRSAVQYDCSEFQFPYRERHDLNSVPDPCCRIELAVTLKPKESMEKTLILAVGETEAQAVQAFQNASDEPRGANPFLGRTAEEKLAKTLLPYLVSSHHSRNRRYRSGMYQLADLWQAGISGDFPLLVCSIRNNSDLERMKPYLDAWMLLEKHGIISDFVILYKEYGDYSRQQYGDICTAVSNGGWSKKIGKRGGIHLINTAKNKPEIRTAILASSAYAITRSLPPEPDTLPAFSAIDLQKVLPRDPHLPDPVTVGGGYFSHDCFVVTANPAVPWSHLLANPCFGTQVTNKSLGFTYAHNARENRLTPWSNDPVTHHTGERLILKYKEKYYDLIDGSTAVFSPKSAIYHGCVEGIAFTVTVTVREMQKHIEVHFDSSLPVNSTVAYYTEPTLHFDRKHSHQIVGSVQEGIPAVFQPFNHAYHGWMAVSSNRSAKICFDALSFWSGKWENTLPPPFDHSCLASVASITDSVIFTLAYGNTEAQARQNTIPKAESVTAHQNSGKIKTSDPRLDVMVNHFLPHQVKASRLYARTGFYQCSGAYGFRDQLQDAGNIALICPDITKQQILLCCSRQFTEGDVLHWWHELPSGPAGVRTRCSDDLLWLPLYTARYVEMTNDSSILNEQVSYLTAPPLAEGVQERYDSHFGTAPAESVYKHCQRALDSIQCSGRGLALIGSCDWNDGFSAIGTGGKGESVWLTQFYAMVCQAFATLAKQMGDNHYKDELLSRATRYKSAVEQHCWDNDRYTRAYFDDGRVIGAAKCTENQLDVLPQAFAVLANLPNHERNRTAVMTAYRTLVDHEHRLIRLFTPAFDTIHAGYISAYPAGIRENGGQYSHGVMWLIQAMLQLGEAEAAYQLIRYVNPASHCEQSDIANRYQGEPYAVAGDVYTHPSCIGQSGWTHYTGAAGWLYRIIWEELFGIRLKNGKIVIRPNLPAALFRSSCRVEIGGTIAEIEFALSKPYKEQKEIPLDGQTHKILIKDEIE